MKDIYGLMAEGKTEEEIKALFEAEMKCAQARKESEEKKAQKEGSLRSARELLVNAFVNYNDYYGWQEEPITNEEIDELLELIIAFEESVMPYVQFVVEAEKCKNKKDKKDVKQSLSDEAIITDFLKGLF